MTNSKRIKVLQMCAVGFTVEKLLLPLVNEMSKEYDVTILCGRDHTSEGLKTRGYKIKNIKIGRRIRIINNLKSLIRLYRYMKKEKFDIVHTHTPLAGILGRIAAKLAGVPIVIYTAHGFYFHENMKPLQKKLFMFFERIGGKLSDYIFTQSSEDYDTALKEGIVSKEKILAIGNGVDIERFSAERLSNSDMKYEIKKRLNINQDEIIITIIGRVVKEKGYLEWVQAAREVARYYKNIKFVAIGDTLESDRDGISNELKEFVKSNNLENDVIFLGSRADIAEILYITDIFTLPSHREGMPRSVIEAMCMGVPVIATDIRGCREEVDEGITGFLVPVGDYKKLAEKIIYLVDHPELRKTMGAKARKKAEREYNEQIVLKRQLNIVSKLIYDKKLTS